MQVGRSGRTASRRSGRKRAAHAALDLAAWAMALLAAITLRKDFNLNLDDVGRMLTILPLVLAVQLLAGYWTSVYRGGWIIGSFEEIRALALTTTITAVVLFAVDVTVTFENRRPVPASAVVGGTMIALLMMAAYRYAWRMANEQRLRPTLSDGRTRVVVFGAGEGGSRAIRAMLRDAESPYFPVAILDDDPDLARLNVQGVRVFGGRDRLADAVVRHEAEMLLIAVPSAEAALVRELIDAAVPLGIDVRILPSTRELLGKDVRVVDIREPNESDLLGRHQVQTDLDSAARYLTGKRVVVTGAGGSIGSELCRQIAPFGPAELIMIDRDESALHAVQLSLEGRALLDSPDIVLLDIRDRDRLARLFEERRPDVVFHAAALKHLPLLESHPIEALKTNVWGSLAVLDAARAAGVGKVVNISTDKAANPCSVLGYSKRVAEGLTAWTASQADGTYLSVRFGNVLGSRGSVLTAFRKQLEQGGPLTVTHPDVTRFFMTVEEAVQLVIQAGAIGHDGEVMVLDMGEPVKIADVARRMAQMADPPARIEYTGLRVGEKLHEELFGDGEVATLSSHPMIRFVDVPGLDPAEVRDLDPSVDPGDIVATFQGLCLKMSLDLVSSSAEMWPGATLHD